MLKTYWKKKLQAYETFTFTTCLAVWQNGQCNHCCKHATLSAYIRTREITQKERAVPKWMYAAVRDFHTNKQQLFTKNGDSMHVAARVFHTHKQAITVHKEWRRYAYVLLDISYWLAGIVFPYLLLCSKQNHKMIFAKTLQS